MLVDWVFSVGFRPEKEQGTWYETTDEKVRLDRRKGLGSQCERNDGPVVGHRKELRGQSERAYNWFLYWEHLQS